MITEQERQHLLKILSYVNHPENMAEVIKQLLERQGMSVTAEDINAAIDQLKMTKGV